MSAEVAVAPDRRFRKQIPKEHRTSLDTRLAWLWNQRFGTVQSVWQSSTDMLDVTAATMLLQAIMAKDLNNIVLVFRRLEGGAQEDVTILDDEITM